MTDRERRNEVDTEDRYIDTEFLIFGSFREDDTDDGFKATRWLPSAELERVDDGEGLTDALGMLDELTNGLRVMLRPEEGSGEEA